MSDEERAGNLPNSWAHRSSPMRKAAQNVADGDEGTTTAVRAPTLVGGGKKPRGAQNRECKHYKGRTVAAACLHKPRSIVMIPAVTAEKFCRPCTATTRQML